MQGFVDRALGCKALGCKALDCVARDYKVPAAAVHMRVVQLEEVASSHLVAVVHIVTAVHIVTVARIVAVVHIAVVVPATGIQLQEDRETVCSVACRVEAALGTVSPVAELAQPMRRRQQDVLREACRGRAGSRSGSQQVLSGVAVVEVPSWCVWEG